MENALAITGTLFFLATILLIFCCKSYLGNLRDCIDILQSVQIGYHQSVAESLKATLPVAKHSDSAIIHSPDPAPIIYDGRGDMDPMGAKVMVTMFFGAAMQSPGTVISHFLPIAANAMSTEGWGVFTNSRCGDMASARTKACIYAIEAGYTHIMMLDNDHKHPANIIRDLLKHDVPIVGGLNYRRSKPYYPCAVTKVEEIPEQPGMTKQTFAQKGSGLQKVAGIGTGCILIRLADIVDLEQPWFYMPYEDFDVPGMVKENWPGEDGGFCLKAGRAGIDMYCDTNITSPHLGEEWVA